MLYANFLSYVGFILSLSPNSEEWEEPVQFLFESEWLARVALCKIQLMLWGQIPIVNCEKKSVIKNPLKLRTENNLLSIDNPSVVYDWHEIYLAIGDGLASQRRNFDSFCSYGDAISLEEPLLKIELEINKNIKSIWIDTDGLSEIAVSDSKWEIVESRNFPPGTYPESLSVEDIQKLAKYGENWELYHTLTAN